MAVNKLGENRVEGHPLPCGRLVEDVFDDLEAGRADEHSRTCPHCATARRGLTTLMEATRALVDDPSEPSPNLLDRIMQAVRAEGRRGAALPLVPTDDTGAATTPVLGPVDVSEQAVAAVVRYAADTVERVRARSCRIIADPADPLALRVEMTVALRYGAGPVEAVVDTVRARIGSALRGQVGVRAVVVDVHVVDVRPEGVRAAVSTSSINQRGGGFDDPRPVAEIRVAAVAAAAARAVPGVAHLQPGLWGLVQQLGTDLWTRVTGKPRPDTGGVEVVIDGDTTTIDITLVTDGLRPAATVAADVQREVHLAVIDSGAAPPARIAVHVVDIALSP